jgi:hypothetical protein
MKVERIKYMKNDCRFGLGIVAFVLLCSNGMADTVVDFNATSAFTARAADTVNSTEHTFSWSDSTLLVDGTPGNVDNMDIYGGFSGQGDFTESKIIHWNARDAVNFEVGNAKTTTSNVTGQIILLWDSADFQGTGRAFDASAGSSMSLSYNTFNNHGATRFVIRDGSQYFLSSDVGVGNVGGSMDGSTVGLEWATFNPTEFQSFDGSSGDLGLASLGTFSAKTFDDVTGVGFMAEGDRIKGNNMVMPVNDFQVALVPEPATLGLIAAAGTALLFLRRTFLV